MTELIQTHGVDSAAGATGVVVIIDVLRAFTTAAYAFDAGAREIRIVATAEEAFDLRRADPKLVLVGEIDGKPIDGFDFGNSPYDVGRAELSGRTLVLRSTSGTQGVVRATGAERVFLGSLVVAVATVRIIRALCPASATFAAMGSPDGHDGDEDVACADYMTALYRGADIDEGAIIRRVEESTPGLLALDPEVPWISEGDLAYATRPNHFDFAMEVAREGQHLIARRLTPPPD